MEHHPNCNDFQDMDPGFAPNTGDKFIKRYADRFVQFPIDTYKKCLGCCLAYLTSDRNYTRLDTQPGLFYVHFPVGNSPADLYRTPSVDGCARVPKVSTGKMGQIATGKEYNLGAPYFRRPFQASRTFQLYVPNNAATAAAAADDDDGDDDDGGDDDIANGDLGRGLSIGFPCINARMESVAIDVVNQAKHHDIADIKLNFFDAVLVERYKEMTPKDEDKAKDKKKDKVRTSFRGYCMTPTGPDPVDLLAEGMGDVAINKQPI